MCSPRKALLSPWLRFDRFETYERKGDMDLLILTGHTSGLGASLLHAGLERGWTVLGIARRQSGLERERFQECTLDLAETGDWESLLTERRATLDGPWRRVILINNAGRVEPTALLEEMSISELQISFQLNAIAPIRLMRWTLQAFAGPCMRFVNISSGAASKPYLGWTAYCSTKAALRMSSEVLAREMEAQGRDVRVLSYAPGVLDTAMQVTVRGLSTQTFPDFERFRQLHSQGQLIEPRLSANELLDRLDRSDIPYFSHCRYGESERS